MEYNPLYTYINVYHMQCCKEMACECLCAYRIPVWPQELSHVLESWHKWRNTWLDRKPSILSLSLTHFPFPPSPSLSLSLLPLSLPPFLSFLILFSPIKLQTEWNAPHYPAGPLCNFNRGRLATTSHNLHKTTTHYTANKKSWHTGCMLFLHACYVYMHVTCMHVHVHYM